MKIEEGKLYYCKVTEKVFKSSTTSNVAIMRVHDKIAVHCPTQGDWDYVTSIYKYDWCCGVKNSDRIIYLDEQEYDFNGANTNGYKIITIEEFKKFYPMEEQTEPKYFAISPQEWNEYQELKKNRIDFDRLKTGSVVRLKYTEQHCNGSRDVDFDKNFDVVFFKTPHLIDCDNEFYKESSYPLYSTFYQDGKYVLFSANKNTDYITEVISY